jgi:hypothetical protein
VEPEPLLFKNGFRLSSFAIAGLIFIVMMAIGGIYLYTVLNDDSSAGSVPEQAQIPSQTEPDNSKTITASVQPAQRAPTTKTSTKIEKIDNKVVSDETRLEKELALRKMAEEEFNLKQQ